MFGDAMVRNCEIIAALLVRPMKLSELLLLVFSHMHYNEHNGSRIRDLDRRTTDHIELMVEKHEIGMIGNYYHLLCDEEMKAQLKEDLSMTIDDTMRWMGKMDIPVCEPVEFTESTEPHKYVSPELLIKDPIVKATTTVVVEEFIACRGTKGPRISPESPAFGKRGNTIVIETLADGSKVQSYWYNGQKVS
jgi:hypothetical protein